MYPTNAEFLLEVREEVRDQIRALGHHASIFLWSANNENEGCARCHDAACDRTYTRECCRVCYSALNWYPETIAARDTYLEDYVKLYERTVRETLLTLDLSRPVCGVWVCGCVCDRSHVIHDQFWPSSPSNGPLVEDVSRGIYTLRWGDVQSEQWGDVH
jgi:hypothetical protein